MDNPATNQGTGRDGGQGSPPEGAGYQTPGEDRLLQSNSPAVPSPSRPSEDKLTTPRPYLRSIDEQPADANPALPQTVAEGQGQANTADLLRARETAEEQYLRDAQAHIYQDSGPDAINPRFSSTDTGQPDVPFQHQEDATTESIDSVDVQQDFQSMSGGVGGMNLRARAEAMMDRDGPETAYTDAMSGQGPFGRKADELDISGPETTHKFVPNDSEIPPMKNIPDEGS